MNNYSERKNYSEKIPIDSQNIPTIYIGGLPFGVYDDTEQAHEVNDTLLRGKGHVGTISKVNLEILIRRLTEPYEMDKMIAALKRMEKVRIKRMLDQ